MELLQSTSVLSQRLENARSPRAPSPDSSLKHQLENMTRERDMLCEQISRLQARHQADTNTLMDQVRVWAVARCLLSENQRDMIDADSQCRTAHRPRIRSS